MVLYKICIISNDDNIYFDDESNFLYFLDNIYFDFRLNIINPYKYDNDNYNKYNTVVFEILKIYIDFKRIEFENYIKNCIKNKNFFSCRYKNIEFMINKSNLNLNDYKIIY